MVRAVNTQRTQRKAKQSSVRITRQARVILNDKYYGAEPVDITKRGFIDALNWYNYMFEPDDMRGWLFEYLKKNNFKKDDVAAIRKLPKNAISKTSCAISRILLNGNILADETMSRFNANIQDMIREGQNLKVAETQTATKKDAPSIQERTQSKIRNLISECEDGIDENECLNVYQWLQANEVTPLAAIAIRDHFTGWLEDCANDELDSVKMKKARAARKIYWEQFIADCDRYAGNKKVTKQRKPREKKQKSAIDLVKGLKYQKEYPPLKIVSITPADMIGCQQLWTYNTKYKKIARYDAIGHSGLQVKGTTIIGFDVETSTQKSVRKPDVVIQQVLAGGKVTLRKLMGDLKTQESKPTGRINGDTVLLRCVRS